MPARGAWLGGGTTGLKQAVNATVTVAAGTLTLSGFTLQAGEFFQLNCNLMCSNADPNISLYVNGNTTAANYRTQRLSANDATVSAARSSNAQIAVGPTTPGDPITFVVTGAVNPVGGGGGATYSTIATQGLRASPLMRIAVIQAPVTVSDITSFTFSLSAGDFSIGSTVKLFRVV